MKKNFIAMAVLASSSAFSAYAAAADGQVKFTGEITDVACQVDSASSSLEVNLGKIAKTAFTGAGSKASATKFTLQLSACPDTVKTAQVKFDGTSVAGNNGVLALTNESGVAEGVGIQLFDDSNNELPLFTASKQYALEESVTNELSFVASYIATSDTIKAGKANATANFTINYN